MVLTATDSDTTVCVISATSLLNTHSLHQPPIRDLPDSRDVMARMRFRLLLDVGRIVTDHRHVSRCGPHYTSDTTPAIAHKDEGGSLWPVAVINK